MMTLLQRAKTWFPGAVVVGITGVLLFLFPSAQPLFWNTVTSYTIELVTILPAVMVLMGVLTVFVSSDFVGRVLGHSSGVYGMAVAFALGTLPTGPLYVAFPFARVLHNKGARTANIVIFLSAWASIKLPQELVELRFLGWRFMAVRLVLTLTVVVIMAVVIDRFTE